ncbi:MAG: sigma factor-like helix-turn-helix DNA-binding protein [Elainellaceae cyanobacterium]
MKNFIPVYSPQRRRLLNILPLSRSEDSFGLLQGVMEGLPDGILILTKDAAIASSNSRARNICQQLNALSDSVNGIPQAIWNICAPLFNGSYSLPRQTMQVENTISIAKSTSIRIRARWLQSPPSSRILVMLEDKHQSAQQQAVLESMRCGLTPRETEVFLYRCLDYTYDEIASTLHITVNTVKKHIKSINMKRDAQANGGSAS